MKIRAALFVTFAVLGAIPFADADDRPLHELIDEHTQQVWKREQLQPAELAADHEFLRRVYLDLVGSIPSHDETVRFLGDASARKREDLITSLLEDPRFAQHQSDIWDLVFFGRNPPGYETDRRAGFQIGRAHV